MTDRHFATVSELTAKLRPEVDFTIVHRDRRSWATIIAPHGGHIEAGTSAIANSVAGRSYNLFDFQALDKGRAPLMHVTSTRFRHPQLDALLSRSLTALSLHGMGTRGDTTIWLGGRNLELKRLTELSLRSAGFSVNPDSPLYRGESPRNVVNLPAHQGVQLELSDELFARLFTGRRFSESHERLETTIEYRRLVRAVRAALARYAVEHAQSVVRAPAS